MAGSPLRLSERREDGYKRGFGPRAQLYTGIRYCVPGPVLARLRLSGPPVNHGKGKREGKPKTKERKPAEAKGGAHPTSRAEASATTGNRGEGRRTTQANKKGGGGGGPRTASRAPEPGPLRKPPARTPKPKTNGRGAGAPLYKTLILYPLRACNRGRGPDYTK